MTQANCDTTFRSGAGQLQELPRVASRRKILVPALIALAGLTLLISFGNGPQVTGGTNSAASSPSLPAQATAGVASNLGVEGPSAAPIAPEIQQLLSRLESADEFLRGTKCYSASFTQEVYKDGRQFDPEKMLLKVQHDPFAVFMQWERDGQQALYVDGKYDNKMLVHPTRGIGALRKVWILEPDHKLAMRSARRPVTEIGMLNMVNLLLGFHHEHILQSHCTLEPFTDGDQSLTRVLLTFDTPQQNPYFAKTLLVLSDETHIPLQIENYGWTEDNQLGPLLEKYDYTDICLEGCVTAADFERENAAYSF